MKSKLAIISALLITTFGFSSVAEAKNSLFETVDHQDQQEIILADKTLKRKSSTQENSLYNRAKWRKGTRQNAIDNAPRNQNGEINCPTCGTTIDPEQKVDITTKDGKVMKRHPYDLDHYPNTWSERKKDFKQQDTPPTRKEVIDEYNRDVRLQCSRCNQSHQFEGVPGQFSNSNSN